MKKGFFSFLALALVSTGAFADTNSPMSNMSANPMHFGVDFALPYTLQADGNEVNDRANFNLGIDGRYFVTQNLNVGGRFSFDIEEQNGTTRQVAFAPGVQYRWFTEAPFNPYVRADLPITFRGAANTLGKTDQADLGISGGLGVAWNLGNAIGVENMMIRYDFNLAYNFGLADAIDTLSIEFFKVGIDYKF